MSYWLYADKAAFISSRRETFGFIIHSKDFAELIKAQFASAGFHFALPGTIRL
jgi:hypothetical protein